MDKIAENIWDKNGLINKVDGRPSSKMTWKPTIKQKMSQGNLRSGSQSQPLQNRDNALRKTPKIPPILTIEQYVDKYRPKLGLQSLGR